MIGILSRVSKSLFPIFLLIISGCATTLPSPHNFRHTAAEAAYIPPSTYLTLSDGFSVPIRLYRPAPRNAPRAVILALHGFGDSRDAWENLAPTLTANNILIAAPDIRGFGEASLASGWSDTCRLRQDAEEEMLWLHHAWPHVPLYLIGESMGSAIVLLLNIHKAPPYLKGTILLAPAIITLGQPWKSLLTGWNWLTPHYSLTGTHAPGPHRTATTNTPALRRLFFDPLTQHSTNVHALHGLVSLMAKADHTAPHAHRPLLVIFGDHDDFIPSRAITALFQNLPPQTRFDEIDNGHHLLSREKYSIASDLLSWIFTPEKLLPSGGDFGANAWRAAQ